MMLCSSVTSKIQFYLIWNTESLIDLQFFNDNFRMIIADNYIGILFYTILLTYNVFLLTFYKTYNAISSE